MKYRLLGALLLLGLFGCSSSGSDDSEPTPVSTEFSVQASAPASGTETQKLALSATTSNAQGTVSYDWTQTAGPSAIIDGDDTATASIQIPLLDSSAVLAFEVSATDGSGASSVASVSITADPEAGASLLEVETVHNGVRRIYSVYTPDTVAAAAPLVMFLHGSSGNMREFIAEGETPRDWLTLADQDGFVVVYPNGYSDNDGDGLGESQSWNDLNGRFSSADDAGFLLSVIDEIATGRPIDTDKVLVGGRSNGGMMAYRMAIEAPDRFAAIASFVGNLAEDPIPDPLSLPTPPILIFGGTEDPRVPFDGGFDNRSIPETVEYFVTTSGADTTLATDRVLLPDNDPDDGCLIFSETYTDSMSRPTVQYYEGVGSGHYIPDPDFVQSQQNINGRGPVICRDANGVELAYAFFQDVLEGTMLSGGNLDNGTALESGANGLFIGQSFFVPVAEAFDDAAQRGGFADHALDTVFAGGANGSPQALWENETQRQAIEQKLATGEVALFGMTIGEVSEDNPGEFYALWIDLALGYNPSTKIFIGFPYLQGGPNKTSDAYDLEITEGGDNFFPVVQGLRDFYPDTDIFYSNYGKVLSQMKAEYEAGGLEDITALVDTQSGLFTDGGAGHSGPMGEHIAALVWAELLYGADTETLVDPAYNADDVLRIASDITTYNRRYLPYVEAE